MNIKKVYKKVQEKIKLGQFDRRVASIIRP